MRYMITGSMKDIFPLPRDNSYCWENYHLLFDAKEDSGLYCGRDKVFTTHALFDRLDVWIVEVGQWYRSSEYRDAVAYAKSKGCLTLACVHSPPIMLVGGFEDYLDHNIENLKVFDGLILHYPDRDFADYLEDLVKVPCLDILPPPEQRLIDGGYDTISTPLPFPKGEYCISANPLYEDLDRRSDILYHSCVKLGIPVCVNIPENKAPRAYLYLKFLQDTYGKHMIKPLERMPLEEYLYVMKNSLFVSVASVLTTLGRPMLDAAMLETLSISIPSGWQQYLFSESTITYSFSMHRDIDRILQDRQTISRRGFDRLKQYPIKEEQKRFSKWIEDLRGSE